MVILMIMLKKMTRNTNKKYGVSKCAHAPYQAYWQADKVDPARQCCPIPCAGTAVRRPRMKLFILSSLLFLELVSCSSDLDCFLDHQECEIHEDNLITTVTDVPTMDQCLALCQDEFTCVAFTYFGTEGYPLRESCVMFSDCSIRRPCQGCTTGSSQSECLCSIQYSSEIDSGNFVDMVSAVDEHDCKRKI